MEITQISKCNVSACTYNQQNICHTPGITVGPHAECNTYNYRKAKGGQMAVKGGIGACLASECRYNDELECKASNIDISVHDSHADCRTFETKK